MRCSTLQHPVQRLPRQISAPAPRTLNSLRPGAQRHASANHRPRASCDVEQGVAALNTAWGVQRCNSLFNAVRGGPGCLRLRHVEQAPAATHKVSDGAQVAAPCYGSQVWCTSREAGAQMAATVHKAGAVRRRGGLWSAAGPCSAAVVFRSPGAADEGGSGAQVLGPVDTSRRRCTRRALWTGAVGCGVRPDLVQRQRCSDRRSGAQVSGEVHKWGGAQVVGAADRWRGR